MSAILKPQVPHVRPMRLDDIAEVLAIEVRAYDFAGNRSDRSNIVSAKA